MTQQPRHSSSLTTLEAEMLSLLLAIGNWYHHGEPETPFPEQRLRAVVAKAEGRAA